MKLPQPFGRWIEFTCNICGSGQCLPAAGFHRELAQCTHCGSTPRFRGVVYALGQHLAQGGRALVDWPTLPECRGLGMSDWEGYATLLSRCCAYENTQFDREPRFDIRQKAPSREGVYDFVLCSDVFEHVAPPLEPAFSNLFSLLRPGGLLVFSVPYHRAGTTQEHYPGLQTYEILSFQGQPILVNRDAQGTLQVYDQLVFHGGSGATLELRLFTEEDVVHHLRDAGFEAIQVLDQPVLSCGYYWPPLPQADPVAPLLYAYVMTARRPVAC